jgi:hypothetical protein
MIYLDWHALGVGKMIHLRAYMLVVLDAPKIFLGMMWGEVDLERDLIRAERMARGRRLQVAP